MADDSKCPVTGVTSAKAATRGTTNTAWWPEALNLKVLHQQSALSNPMDPDFDYAAEFKTLDLDAVVKDCTR